MQANEPVVWRQAQRLKFATREKSLLILQSQKRTSTRIVPARFHLDGRIVNEAPVAIDRKDGRIVFQQSGRTRHFADDRGVVDDIEMIPPAFNVGGISDISTVSEHDIFFG